MARSYDIAKYTRRMKDGKEYRITLEVDACDLLQWLGTRAINNKSKRVFYLNKAVKVTAEEIA